MIKGRTKIKGTSKITVDGIPFYYRGTLGDYGVFASGKDRILVDSKGHITHRDNPEAEDILPSYNVSLREDARKLASTIVAWEDAKTWSQSQ